MNLYIKEFLKNKDIGYIENFKLSSASYIKIGGVVDLIAYPDSIEKFVWLLNKIRELGLKYKVVGGMSNILFSDCLSDCVIIKTDKLKGKSRAENIICAECGNSIRSICNFAMSFGLGGFEELYAIPGTVGGALHGNSGAFLKCIFDSFVEGYFYSENEMTVKKIKREELKFSYRYSDIEERGLIFLYGSFLFCEKSKSEIQSRIKEFADKRKNNQPINYPSLGCVFKRVSGVGAGFYIDRCGLKGLRVGDAEVSQKHAGFIVNRGNATFADVLNLIEIVKEKVFDKFSIILEEEIEIIN